MRTITVPWEIEQEANTLDFDKRDSFIATWAYRAAIQECQKAVDLTSQYAGVGAAKLQLRRLAEEFEEET